jgi:cytochrome c oxidase assembly factor 6
MGWWPLSSDPRGDAIRSGSAIPNRAERSLCWSSRDALFACLDAHGIVDATKDPGAKLASSKCSPELKDLERDCAAAWVQYFKQWRVADVQKRRRLEELRAKGATEMTVSTSFAPPQEGAGQGTAVGAGKQDIQDMVDKRRR